MPPRNHNLTRYIPPAHLPVIVREFVEPVPDDYFIHWLFRYRCMDCRRSEQLEINEIEPRGRSKKNILNWKNRVVLCRICHTKFHHNGVSKEKVKAMTELRETYLKSIGREQYLNIK
jgi:hypothetical protein